MLATSTSKNEKGSLQQWFHRRSALRLKSQVFALEDCLAFSFLSSLSFSLLDSGSLAFWFPSGWSPSSSPPRQDHTHVIKIIFSHPKSLSLSRFTTSLTLWFTALSLTYAGRKPRWTSFLKSLSRFMYIVHPHSSLSQEGFQDGRWRIRLPCYWPQITVAILLICRIQIWNRLENSITHLGKSSLSGRKEA